MSSSCFVNGSGVATQNDALTRFYAMVGALRQTTTSGRATEAEAQIKMKDGGVFSYLFVYVSVNTHTTADSTFHFRKNAANQTLTVVYAAGQTGIKEDTSNTVTVAVDDVVNYRLLTAANAGTTTTSITGYGIKFAPTTSSNTVSFYACSGNSTLTAAGTRYTGAGLLSNTTTEADTKSRMRLACTADRLRTYVNTNARTTDVTWSTRKNGADGSQTVTYTAGQTGEKEDTTNSDTLAAGDDFNFKIVFGAGTENFIINTLSTRLTNTAKLSLNFNGSTAVTQTQAFNVTNFASIAGSFNGGLTTTEADVQFRPRSNYTAKELGGYLSANTIATSDTTIRFRVNTADGNQVLTWAAGVTGLKSDTSNTDVLTSGSSLVNYKITTPNTSGSITIRWVSVLFLAPEEVAATKIPYMLLLGVH